MDESGLKKILDEHKIWKDTHGKKGNRFVLLYADLRGANLVDADLRGASLKADDLVDAHFRFADFNGAKLTGAKLT